MSRLNKGLKLQYKDANAFIEMILKALTIEDGKEDVPFIPNKITEEEKMLEGGSDDGSTAPTQPIIPKVIPVRGVEKKDTDKASPSKNVADPGNVCYFYTINKTLTLIR